MNDLLMGKLVHLAAPELEEFAKHNSRWWRDTEFARLADASVMPMRSAKNVQTWLEGELTNQPAHKYWFVIRRLEDDALIGDINLDIVNWSGRNAYVGMGIGDRAYWSKGYGTDALRVALHYAFLELNLYRVTLTVFEYNPRAIRSYEKVGFRHEGRMRGRLNKEGQRWDMLFMGILRAEWKEYHENK